jgi:CheY-like chemotaxis protein
MVVYDETGGLDSELMHYADKIEFVTLQDLSQCADVLRRCPAHALVINTAQHDHLCSLVGEVARQSPETPVIGCTVPRRALYARQRGALGHLVKPVTRSDLEQAIRAVGRPIRRVLVVDDEAEVLKLWTRTLRVYDRAIEVVTVSSGRQALDALEGSAPDLVLLDVAMPDMDGWQVLDRIRQDDRKRDIPVIVVSGVDPVDQPPESEVLLAAMGKGLSINCLLRCSLDLASHLLRLDRELGPALG